MEILDRRSAQGSSIKNIFRSRNSFMTEAFLSVLMSTLLRWTESNGINKCCALCCFNSAWMELNVETSWLALEGWRRQQKHALDLPSLPKPPMPQFVTTRLTLGNYYCGRLRANLWKLASAAFLKYFWSFDIFDFVHGKQKPAKKNDSPSLTSLPIAYKPAPTFILSHLRLDLSNKIFSQKILA